MDTRGVAGVGIGGAAWGRGLRIRWRWVGEGPGGSTEGTREALTFALFARGLGASRRHLFAGCDASRLITLPAA